MADDKTNQEKEQTPIEESEQEVVDPPHQKEETSDLELINGKRFHVVRAVLMGVLALADLAHLLIGSSLSFSIKESLRRGVTPAQTSDGSEVTTSQHPVATVTAAFALGLVEAMGLVFAYAILFISIVLSSLGILFSVLRLKHLPKKNDWKRIFHSILLGVFIVLLGFAIAVFCYVQFGI